ncbi:hypothetical protein LUZ60_006726 [Juncus effusus]|nr:hypothetical protein LUZ60_006726 [Juncus effusus]
MSRHPSTKWAQRSDVVFITVELPDAKDVKLKLKPEGRFYFSAVGSDGLPYELDFELFDKVKVDESKAAIGSRHIVYVVAKEEKKWWARLLKQPGRPPVFLKVDWDKWIDEDEEKSGGDMDFGGMDFSNLGMGGPSEFDDDGDDDAVESAPIETEEATETGEAKTEEEEEKKP